jgi:hypothetical protein
MATTPRVEVFLRAAPLHAIRLHLAEAAIHRWMADGNIDLHLLWMEESLLPAVARQDVMLPAQNFHWHSRVYAEKHAKREFYILTDDDHLILGENWAQRAWNEMKRSPTMGMLSGRSVIHQERLPNHSGSMGCPCILRKGVLDFSQASGPANLQDEVVVNLMHQAGYQHGYLEGCDYIHCGFGLSQVEPKLWLRY